MLKITGLEIDKLKSKIFIEKELLEYTKEDSSEKRWKRRTNKETVPVDVSKLKNILYNRLKSYHENHIDNLILQYDLQGKTEKKKKQWKKYLEAIHI